MNKKSDSDLTNKYVGKTFSSPLVGRNKYPDVDVFSFRGQFLLVGMALSLFIMVGAFGFTSYERTITVPDYALDLEEDIEVAPPRSSEPPPPPPPPPPPVITEVPNETILEEDQVEFLDQSVEVEEEVIAPVRQPKVEKTVAAPPPPPPIEEPEVVEIFQVVEEMPRFPGCEHIGNKKEKYECSQQKILEFIYGNIQYPPVARNNNIEGTVVVRFVVNETGKVDKIELLKDIGGKCGDEAIRVVKLMNKKGITWFPGSQRGRAVKVYMNLPIRFKLIT